MAANKPTSYQVRGSSHGTTIVQGMTRIQRTIKMQYPDHVLLFAHDAESYRAYNDDAQIAWSFTPAQTYADVFSVARVDADALIANMVAAGHKVAICEQVGRI